MSARTLTILGCDGSHPGPGGAASGYLVRATGLLVALDMGPGTFANLQTEIDPGQLDAVIITHEHPDHMGDLDSLAVWRMHHEIASPVSLYAPEGVRERCYFADQGVFEFHLVHGGDVVEVADAERQRIRVEFSQTDHGPETLAVALCAMADPAASLAYSADTGAEWSPAAFSVPISTYLCEASYLESAEGRFRHLSGRQAGRLAGEAGVDTLITTHRWVSTDPDALLEETQASFGRAVRQATLRARFEW